MERMEESLEAPELELGCCSPDSSKRNANASRAALRTSTLRVLARIRDLNRLDAAFYTAHGRAPSRRGMDIQLSAEPDVRQNECRCRRRHSRVHALAKTGGTALRSSLRQAFPPEVSAFVYGSGDLEGSLTPGQFAGPRARVTPAPQAGHGALPVWSSPRRSIGPASMRRWFVIQWTEWCRCTTTSATFRESASAAEATVNVGDCAGGGSPWRTGSLARSESRQTIS